MSRKIVIFPVDRTSASLARYTSSLLMYEPVPLLPPSLSILENQDISELDGGYFANIKLSISYYDELSKSELIYFCDSSSITDNDLYHDLIKYAKGIGKEVIISKYLMARLDMLNENDMETIEYLDKSAVSKLIEIDTPIISIFTQGRNCDQANIEMSLRKYFIDKKYRVMQIGTRICSELFGFNAIPDFLCEPSIDTMQKIVMFNRFVYNLSISENPDIIIIGVPEGIMKYNNRILNGLGVMPFIIQSAIQSDIGIVSLYQNNYTKKYLDELMLYCKYKLGVLPKYFNFANTKQMKNIDDNSVTDYLFLNSEFVLSNVYTATMDEDFTIFNSLNLESSEKTYQKIEAELISNLTQI
jgi:peptide maturation system protein (TIGR04066 family)